MRRSAGVGLHRSEFILAWRQFDAKAPILPATDGQTAALIILILNLNGRRERLVGARPVWPFDRTHGTNRDPAFNSAHRCIERLSNPGGDGVGCEHGAKKEYVSETTISHTAPLRYSVVQIVILTELDFQTTAPSPAMTEMRPFERIAKIVSERPVGNVQNVKSRRADDSFTLENRDAR